MVQDVINKAERMTNDSINMDAEYLERNEGTAVSWSTNEPLDNNEREERMSEVETAGMHHQSMGFANQAELVTAAVTDDSPILDSESENEVFFSNLIQGVSNLSYF